MKCFLLRLHFFFGTFQNSWGFTPCRKSFIIQYFLRSVCNSSKPIVYTEPIVFMKICIEILFIPFKFPQLKWERDIPAWCPIINKSDPMWYRSGYILYTVQNSCSLPLRHDRQITFFLNWPRYKGKLYLPTCSKIPVLPCGGILIQTETDTKTGARQKERERLVFSEEIFPFWTLLRIQGSWFVSRQFSKCVKNKNTSKKIQYCKTWPREHVVKDRRKIFMYHQSKGRDKNN